MKNVIIKMLNTIKNLFCAPLYWISGFFLPKRTTSESTEQNVNELSLLESLTTKWKTRDFTFRPLNEMFVKDGFTYPVKFSDTFRTNMNYYSTNYFVFATLMFSYICFTSPLFLFTSATSAALHYYQGFNIHVIGGSVVALMITGGSTLLAVLLLTLGSVGLHSVFRTPFVLENVSEKTD